MKRLSILFLLACLLLCLPACQGSGLREVRDLPASLGTADFAINMYSTETLEELESVSEHIVLCVVKDVPVREVVVKEGGWEDGFYTFKQATTLITVEVKEVYKGSFQPGDEVIIGEPWCTDVIDGEEILISRSGYVPSLPGTAYLFFLHERFAPEDIEMFYCPMAQTTGRHPAVIDDGTTYGVKTGRAIRTVDDPVVRDTSMFKEVVEKYFSE